MNLKGIAFYAALVLAVGAGAWAVYDQVRPDAQTERLARLRQLDMPHPGAQRYAFLMREVPDVVSQVTCACCARTLNQCYGGACPVDCGPCNEQGKAAYELYAHGRTVQEIQGYMAKNHPVRVGATAM